MTAVDDNFNYFVSQQAGLGTGITFSNIIGNSVYEFGADFNKKIPYHIRTGAQAMGDPTARKRFWAVKFHGAEDNGTLHVRIYIDGRYVCEGRAVAVSSFNKLRQVNLPNGWNIGYTIDVEFASDTPIRALEFDYD
jgi:hypothetical protein